MSKRNLTIRLLATAVGALSLAGCSESPVVPQLGAFEWSSASEIANVPETFGRVAPRPSHLEPTRGGGLLMTLSVPRDTAIRHRRYGLGLMSFDGTDWGLEGILDGPGPSYPAAVSASPGRAEVFWQVVPAEFQEPFADRQPTPRVVTSCIWGETCSNPQVVVRTDGSLQWSKPTRFFGTTYMAYSSRNSLYLMPLGAASAQEIGRGFRPVIHRLGDVLVLVSVGSFPTPRFEGVSYILSRIETRVFDGRTFSQPTLVGRDSLLNAYNPTLATDSDGTLHLAYYVQESKLDGATTILHATTRDGFVWSDPDTVFVHEFWPPGTIEMASDSRGNVHLTSGSLAYLLEQTEFGPAFGWRNLYSRWEDGAWTQPTELFPETDPYTQTRLAVDEDDRLHAVWESFNKEVYHATLRR